MYTRLAVAIYFLVTLGNATAQTEDYKVEVAKNDFKSKQVVPPSPEAAAL